MIQQVKQEQLVSSHCAEGAVQSISLFQALLKETYQCKMQTNLVSWNPSSQSQFISYSQNKLHLLEFGNESKSGERTIEEVKAWEAPQLQCLDWRPPVDSSVLAYGTKAGTVHLVNAESGDEISVSQGTKLGKRSCNAVSWNKLMPSQLLAGFDSMKSEFCAIVWDFEHEHYLQTSFSEAACSVSWLPDNAHSLAVGTSMGWVKVYDTRTNTSGASCSIMAHPAPRPRKIRGIRPDPFRSHLFATYSDYPGDVVKVWDLRKVANPGSKAAVVPPSFIVYPQAGGSVSSPMSNNNTHSTSYFVNGGGTEAEAVADVAWSTSRPGVLAVATSSKPIISFFSTSTASGSSQLPLYSVAVPEPVQINGLSWQLGAPGPFASMSESGSSSASLAASGASSPLQADRKSIVASMTVPMSSLSLLSSSSAASTSAAALPSWEAFRQEEELRSSAHASILKPAAAGNTPHVPLSVHPHPRLLAATVNPGNISGGGGGGGSERRKDGFAEVEVLDRIPLAISTAGGLLAVNTAKGRQVALTKSSVNQLQCRQFLHPKCDPGTGEELPRSATATCDLYKSTDVCDIMRRRCLAGYSADAYANVDVLAEELDLVYGASGAQDGGSSPQEATSDQLLAMAVANTKAVYRTWVWMDRFETTVNESGLTVSNCGVLEVLLRSQIQQSTGNLSRQQNRVAKHAALGTLVFCSERRDLSKKMCGWIKMFGLGSAIVETGTSAVGSASTKAKGVNSRAAVDAEKDWDTSADDDLLEVIVDEFFLDSFERAAAIALWHGRLDLAVSVLRRAISQMEQLVDVASLNESGAQKVLWDAPFAAGYLQTISLVAMCFAGYNFPQSHGADARSESPGKGKASPVKLAALVSPAATWASMCRHVLVQLQHSAREATGYLAAACHFLLANLRETDSEGGNVGRTDSPILLYASILSDQRLTMEDRVAFACTYLPDEEVTDWLVLTTERCTEKGAIEGLIITGLSSTGLSILQKYVDVFDDVQTVALLVSRVIDSQQAHAGEGGASSGGGGAGSSATSGPTREWMWLHEYRNLLNKWEMFIERAYLDVELGKRYRRKAAMLAGSGSAPLSAGRGGPTSSLKKGMPKGQPQAQSQQNKGGKAGRVLYRLPVHSDYPHFYLRCGFCGVTLPVDGMQNIRPEHLRLQNNVLNCCAACNKQLPRCYVCQLYMGMVNPYLELNRVMTQKRISADKMLASSDRGVGGGSGAGGGGSSGTGSGDGLRDDGSVSSSGIVSSVQQKELDHNTVSFGKWFFFCQHCRHGGHANCIDQWFGGDAPTHAGNVSVCLPVKRAVCGVNGCECRCIARL